MSKISEKSDDINPNFPKEWETARSLLSFFDDKLYDLRKYGFSFITALIAADGFILTTLDPAKAWPDDIKFAILFVNILLIVGLTTIDRNLSVIQKAGASRARVLERAMNLELSEVITQRYRGARLDYFATGLYAVFVVAVMFLASFILDQSGFYYWFLMATGIGAITLLIAIRHYIKVEYPHGKIDWTLDRLGCTEGDKIRITLTNLSKKELPFSASTVMWEVREEGDTKPISGGHGKIKSDLTIPAGDSCTWLWPTENCCGVYRVYRYTLTDTNLVPLKRKIIVKEKTESKPEPTLVKLVK